MNAPELVDPWQDGDGAVPDVAGVVDLPGFHLHLGVFEPQSDVPVVHIQSALVDRTGPEFKNETETVIRTSL